MPTYDVLLHDMASFALLFEVKKSKSIPDRDAAYRRAYRKATPPRLESLTWKRTTVEISEKFRGYVEQTQDGWTVEVRALIGAKTSIRVQADDEEKAAEEAIKSVKRDWAHNTGSWLCDGHNYPEPEVRSITRIGLAAAVLKALLP